MPDRINPEIQAGQTGGIATGNLGRPNAVSNIGQARARQADNTQWGPDVVGGLLGFAEGIAKQAWQDQTEREYEQAARARRAGKAFEELEGNPLLKPFRRGGFQDMDFQLGQAEMQAEALKLSKDLPQLRPDQMQVWMDSKSADIWAKAGDGLSRKQRSVAMQAQMKLEDSIMSQHTKAHAEWIIQDSYSKLSAQATSNILGIQASGGDIESVQNLAATMTRIQEELPWDMAGPVLQHILKTLYEDGYRHQADALFKGGPDGMGVTAGWDLEARYAMEAASRKAYDKELKEVSIETAQAISRIVANYDAGGILTPEDVAALPESVKEVLGNIALGRYMAGKNVGASANKQAEMSQVYALKNPIRLNAGGYDTAAASAAHYQQLRALYPNDPIFFVTGQLTTDAAYGYVSPKAVNDLGLSLTAYLNSPDGQVSEYHQKMVDTYTAMFKAHYTPGTNSYPMGQVEAMLPKNLQGLFTRLALDNTGQPINELILEWQDAEDRATKAATAERVLASKGGQDLLEGFEATMTADASNKILRTLKNITGLGEKEVAPGTSTWNTYLKEGQAEIRHILASEAGAVGRYIDMPEVLYGKALQQLKDRTITLTYDTSWGVNQNVHLVLPRENNGVPAMDALRTDRSGKRVDRDPRHIKEAIKQQVPTAEGFSVYFEHTAEGIRPIYIDKTDGTPVEGPVLDFEKAARYMDNKLDAEYGTHADSVLGTDVTVKDTETGEDLTIPMHGKNLSGIDTVKVLEWRKSLAEDVGVRQEVHDDTTGVSGGGRKVAGIGYSFPAENMYMQPFKEGERLSPEVISNLYASSTTTAIKQAEIIADRVDIVNEDAILGIAEVVFHVGRRRAENFEQVFQHIAAGRRHAELEAQVKAWPEYQQAPELVNKFLRAVKPAYRD